MLLEKSLLLLPFQRQGITYGGSSTGNAGSRRRVRFLPLCSQVYAGGFWAAGWERSMALCPSDPKQDAPPQGFSPVLPTLLLQSFNGKGSGSASLGNLSPSQQFLLE